MSRRLPRACVLLALTAALLAGPAAATPAPPGAEPPPSGSIGLRLLDAPVDARDDPRARVYIVDHLAPGAVIERRVEVSNTTESPASVALYAAAATVDDGSFVGAAADTPNELSSWTTLDPGSVDVPADGVATAVVTISVPADAAPGEQYGVVWAEVRSDATDGGVVQVSRVGIRLYVSVGEGGAPAADFTVDSLTAVRGEDGAPHVLATVHNTGGRALDMSGDLGLTGGPGGLSAGPFTADLGRTLGIGDTHELRIVLDPELPAGPWDAQVLLRSGLVEREANGTITFPDAGSAAPVAVTSGLPTWVVAAVAGTAVLLLLAAVAAVAVRARARRRVPVGRHGAGGRHGAHG